jgi:hypothetical protein
MAIDKALENQLKVPQTVYDEEVELMAEQPQEFQEGGDVDVEMTCCRNDGRCTRARC